MSFRSEYIIYSEARQWAKSFRHHPDVNDIHWGIKQVGGKPVASMAIRFNVRRKLPKSKLKGRMLPATLGPFDTDVTSYHCKPHVRQEPPAALVRPLMGGLQLQSSLFKNGGPWGTFGCVIRINSVDYGITNYHVAFGEDIEADPAAGLIMLQPRYRNFGEPVGKIAPCYSRSLDFALIKLATDYDLEQSVNGIAGKITGYAMPFNNMPVCKFAAASGFTVGRVDARSLLQPHRIIISNELSRNGQQPVSLPGDSGAVWLYRHQRNPLELQLLALHYGGDQAAGLAFATLFSSIRASIQHQIPSIKQRL